MEFNINLKYENGTLTVDYNDGSKNETYAVNDINQLPERIKTIIQEEVDEYTKVESTLSIADHSMYNCAECGAPINAGDKYIVCADCGGVFCAKCAHDGSFENHECDDGDLGDEED